MSLSTPQITNPATRFFKWKGGDGKLVYWDKEQEKEVTVSLPFKFVVLDQLTTIRGWSDKYEGQIFSNEVRSTKRDILYVRAKGGDIASGTYENAKDAIKSAGGKYARSVYIAFEDDGTYKIGNITWAGASVTDWFDMMKRVDVGATGVVLASASNPQKKGATTFFVPVFDSWSIPADTFEVAVELDRELQKFLDEKLSKDNNSVVEKEESKNIIDEMMLKDNDDEIDDKKPIDLSEIPF